MAKQRPASFICRGCGDPLDSDRVKKAGQQHLHTCQGCNYVTFLSPDDMSALGIFVQMGRQAELEQAAWAAAGLIPKPEGE